MSPTRFYQRLALEWWLVLTAACAILSLIVAFQLTNRLDFVIYDAAQNRLSAPADPAVLIVAVDNRSVTEEGEWPWPRERLARLIGEIGKAAPQSVGIDLLLLGERDQAGDEALAAAMAGTKAYLPLQFEVPGQNGAPFQLTPPLALLQDRASALGHVNIVPDRDGLLRRAYLSYSDGRQSWPALAALMAGTAGPSRTGPSPAAGAGPLVGRDPRLIAFAGPAGSFPAVSASSVLRGEVPAELLRDRRILVGVTASGLGDVYATPTGVDGSLMPGVEIQANLLSTLLTHRAVAPADAAMTLLFSLLPILVIMIGLRVLAPRWTLPLIVGVALGVLGASAAALHFARFWLPPASALAVIVLLYPVWTWRKLTLASRYLSQELERSDTAAAIFARDKPDDPPADVLDRQIHLLSRAVERERDLSKFLRDRLSQMPDCVIVTDLEGLTLFANDKARQLFRDLNGVGDLLYADDLLNYLHAVRPTGRVPVRFSAASQLKGIPWNCAAETTSGQSFDVRFQPQRNSAQDLVGYVVRIVDNTDVITTQRQRNDALELLSHDMRAPQSAIISFIDGLAPGEISSEAARRIRADAGRTLKLADDFVHLARAQTVEVRIEPVDLVALTVEAAQALWPQASAKGITFAHDFAEPELWLSGDASLLARMLGNLIDNAVKFSPAKASIGLACRSLAHHGAAWCSVTVTNFGEGIPPERMAELYRRFQSTAPAGTHGVGLGLAFVHTVAVRHRGKVTCRSVAGGQTAFTVELPAEVSPSGLLPPPIAG
ncbi:MAG: CHASE2 domain-containing protein [Novosphingobium sp.]